MEEDTFINVKDGLLFAVAIGLLSLGFCIGMIVGTETSPSYDIGQMVCEEKGLGEFKGFDKQNKIIQCGQPQTTIPYDGGKILVVNDWGDFMTQFKYIKNTKIVLDPVQHEIAYQLKRIADSLKQEDFWGELKNVRKY